MNELTCEYCRRAPVTNALVVEMTVGRITHLVCCPCGQKNIEPARKLARAPALVWLLRVSPERMGS